MFKLACVLNALMVLPFAVSALAAPDFTFAQFAIDLGPEGAVVARGYGATALGWGIACALLRNVSASNIIKAFMTGSVAFNGAEVLLQLPVALAGSASAMIWVTIIGHAIVAAVSLLALLRAQPA